MSTQLRYLFAVQHEYHDIAQATRARALLRLSSSIAVLGMLFSVYLIAVMLLGIGTSTNALQGGVVFPVFVGLPVLALWLTQKGRIDAAAAVMGLLLWTSVGLSLFGDGLTPPAVLTIPTALTFTGLIYGPRGITGGLLVGTGILILSAYLQSEDRLAAPAAPFKDLLGDALVSGMMLSLVALLLGIFSWNMQSALLRANRIVVQTRATAEVGQYLSQILNLDELLSQAVDLLRDRFAFYHAQIFTVDDNRTYANLVASTGEIGQALLSQGFRVPVGPNTMVGAAISTEQLMHTRDTTTSSFSPIESLAHTRSEVVIPLTVGGRLFGVLDIHSLRPNAFSNEDVETLRVIANQLAQSFQNAQLFEAQQRSLLQNRQLFLDSETNLREIQRLNRQLTGLSWQEYVLARDENQFSVHIVDQELQTDPVEWTPAMHQAIERQRLVSQQTGDDQILAIPISVRGQPIGAIEVHLSGPHNQSEIRSILQAVTERMTFSLENARLFEQAQASAEREQQINRISAQLHGLTSVEDVLTTALSALSESLEADAGAVRLVSLDAGQAPAPASSGNGHQE